MRKRMRKLNQNNTKGNKGRMLRSEEGNRGCCGRRGRIIIWLLPLWLSHYSSCRLSFHLHFFSQRGFESTAREVNILSTNQRFSVSCFLYFVLLGCGSTTQHGLQQHYSCPPSHSSSFSLSRICLHFFPSTPVLMGWPGGVEQGGWILI